jgi:hypothetical protein
MRFTIWHSGGDADAYLRTAETAGDNGSIVLAGVLARTTTLRTFPFELSHADEVSTAAKVETIKRFSDQVISAF